MVGTCVAGSAPAREHGGVEQFERIETLFPCRSPEPGALQPGESRVGLGEDPRQDLLRASLRTGQETDRAVEPRCLTQGLERCDRRADVEDAIAALPAARDEERRLPSQPGHGLEESIREMARVRAGKTDPLDAVDVVNRFEEPDEIARSVVRRLVMVDDLAEQLHFLAALRRGLAHFSHDVAPGPHALVAARVRYDAEAAELVAALDDRHVGLDRIRAPSDPQRPGDVVVVALDRTHAAGCVGVQVLPGSLVAALDRDQVLDAARVVVLLVEAGEARVALLEREAGRIGEQQAVRGLVAVEALGELRQRLDELDVGRHLADRLLVGGGDREARQDHGRRARDDGEALAQVAQHRAVAQRREEQRARVGPGQERRPAIEEHGKGPHARGPSRAN